MNYIPDKTKMALAFFWLWTYFLYLMTRGLNCILYAIITWVPDNIVFCSWWQLFSSRQRNNINIIDARDDKNESILNKLNLLLNTKWDPAMCDEKGGIDLDKFAKCLNTSIIWVSYFLDHKYDEELDIIRIIVIDIKNKIITKYKNIDSEKESFDILFGEIDFH